MTMLKRKYKHMPDTIKDVMQILEEHVTQEEQRFDGIHSELRLIKENHLAHIEQRITGMENKLTTNTSDIGWIKWIVTTTLGAVLVGIIAAILTLILK